MKELKTYLSEAVIRGGHKHRSEFPKHPDIEEIANFLEYNGFEKYDGQHTLSVYSNYYSNGDAYEMGFHGKLLNMYKHRDNAIFCIWLGVKTDKDKYYANFGDFASNPGGPSNVNQVFYKTYDEFRDAVIDHYGW